VEPTRLESSENSGTAVRRLASGETDLSAEALVTSHCNYPAPFFGPGQHFTLWMVLRPGAQLIANSCSPWRAVVSALSWGHPTATCRQSTWLTLAQPLPRH
jgi:hypothetical protein